MHGPLNNTTIADVPTIADVTAINVTVLFAHPYVKAVIQIWKYCPPLLIVLGTIGNILSLMVLTQKQIWRLPSSPYLVVLAVSDVIALYVTALQDWLLQHFDIDITQYSLGGCRTLVYLVYVSLDYPIWIVTCFSMERFLSIMFPLKFRMISSRRNTVITLGVVLAALALLNGHFLIGYGYTNDDGVFNCYARPNTSYAQFYFNVWSWIDMAVFCLIPFIIITVCNISILLSLARNRNAKIRSSKDQTDGAQQRSMIILLVMLSVAFITFTMPISLYFLWYPFWYEDRNNRTIHEIAGSFLFYGIAENMMFMNNCVNFFMYVVSGKTFRNALLGLFFKKYRVDRKSSFRQTVSTTGTTVNLGVIGTNPD